MLSLYWRMKAYGSPWSRIKKKYAHWRSGHLNQGWHNRMQRRIARWPASDEDAEFARLQKERLKEEIEKAAAMEDGLHLS